MGRPSKLTPGQWDQIGKRLLAGEKARVLAREFGIAESTIRERFSEINGKVKDAANQLLAAEGAMAALPLSAQISAINLAAHLRSISTHLASAANNGAMVAHRLSGIALQQVEKVDDAEPEKSIDALKRIGALTRLVNESADLGLNLLSANKERIKSGELDAEPVEPVEIVVNAVDASEPEPDPE